MRKARDATAILRFPRAHAIRPGLVSTESEKTALHWPDREQGIIHVEERRNRRVLHRARHM